MAKYSLQPGHNHDEIYEKIGAGGVTDHGALSGLSDNDHPQYLLTSGKAADSDKLDNIDSTGFVQTSGDQTVAGVKTFSSIPLLPASNPTTSNQAVRKGYADGAYLGINGKAADSTKLEATTPTLVGLSLVGATNAAAARTAIGMRFITISGMTDDTATSITPSNSQGFLLIRRMGGSTGACIAFDAISGTAYCMMIAGTADIAVTTGILTGTSGVDGKLTISAATNGLIYINNRLGATIYLGYYCL